MTPTREFNEEEKREAREAPEELKKECEHMAIRGGKCLLYNEMCFHEEQNLCPDYAPKYVNIKAKNKK